jgi:hypothetical protein
MAYSTGYFDNGEAYERLMDRWSREAGLVFLEWIARPERARWLDVECGTGVFTKLVLDTRAPSVVIAVHPTLAQIEHARRPWTSRCSRKIASYTAA